MYRLSVTTEPQLRQAVREAAGRSGVSVSRWLSDAASDHLRNQVLGAALDAWEADDGPFTDALDSIWGRRVGELLARSGSRDVGDGHLALLVASDDTVLTSDPGVIRRLLDMRNISATLELV